METAPPPFPRRAHRFPLSAPSLCPLPVRATASLLPLRVCTFVRPGARSTESRVCGATHTHTQPTPPPIRLSPGTSAPGARSPCCRCRTRSETWWRWFVCVWREFFFSVREDSETSTESDEEAKQKQNAPLAPLPTHTLPDPHKAIATAQRPSLESAKPREGCLWRRKAQQSSHKPVVGTRFFDWTTFDTVEQNNVAA